MTVPVTAECRHCTAGERGHTAGFEFTDISPGHQELLRRLIRASLSGREMDLEGLMAGEDPQTPRKRGGAGQPQPAQRPPKPLGRYVALFMAIGVLGLVAAATAYRNFMLIEPNFAAVTAPRIDIRAPGPGILQAHDLKAGDRVERDAKLTSVKNVDLESDLILAQAAQSYNSQLIENLQNNIDGGANQVSLANSAKPANGESVSFETVSPEIARARIDPVRDRPRLPELADHRAGGPPVPERGLQPLQLPGGLGAEQLRRHLHQRERAHHDAHPHRRQRHHGRGAGAHG